MARVDRRGPRGLHGLITYNADKYQEDHVTWWDAVDVISSSGYYPIDEWENQLDRIEPVVAASRQAVLLHRGRLPQPRGLARPAQRLGLRGAPREQAQADGTRRA